MTSWTIWCSDPWLISICAAISFTVTRPFSFAMASTAAMASGVTTRCAWPGRGASVAEVTAFRSWVSYCPRTLAVLTDMHHHTEHSFIDEFRWVKPSLLKKNEWQNAVHLWCMSQAGQPFLHYCCAVMLHSCIVLPPFGHSSNHEYHCCQLTGQSSGV